MADDLEQTALIPGIGGDYARSRIENPPLPFEYPADTEQRLDSQALVEQRAQQNVNRMKGIDLAQRHIPTFTDPSGSVQAVTDATGAPVANYDKSHNVGWDSTGSPVQVTYGETGPPRVEDAFTGIQPTVDQKTGAMYRIRPGLPWDYTGQAPDATAAALESQKDKATKDLATALGRKLSLDEHAFTRAKVDYGHNAKALAGQFGLDGTEGFDDIAQKVDEHFNNEVDGYGSPQANKTEGWFGGGNLTPDAQAYRSQIDQQKASALQRVAALKDASDKIQVHGQAIEQERAQRAAVLQQQIDRQMQKAQAAGAVIPGIRQDGQPNLYERTPTGDVQTDPSRPYDAITQAANDGAIDPPDPHTVAAAQLQQTQTQAQSANLANAIQAAKAGQKPYTVDDQNRIQLDNEKPFDSISQAVADGIMKEPPPEVLKAAQQKQQLIEQAGKHPEIKAALAGAGRGAAFLAASPIGAGIGAEALSELGPIGIGAGGLIGGLVTGSIGAHAYGKVLEKLGEYNDTINSFVASQKLHPIISSVGELATFGVGLPTAATKAIGALAGRGADALAEASAVPGSTVDAIRATQAAQKAEAAASTASKAAGASAAGNALGGAPMKIAGETWDKYSVAANMLDAVAQAYTHAGGVAKTIDGLSTLAKGAAKQAADAGENATLAATKAVAARVAIAAGGMAAIDTAIKEGGNALGLTDEHQSVGGLGMAAVLGALTAGHALSGRGYEGKPLEDIMVRGWARDFEITPEMAKGMGIPETQAQRFASAAKQDPLTPEEREVYDAVNKAAMKGVQDGTLTADPTTWQIKAAQVLNAGRKIGVASADVEPGGRGTKPAGGSPSAPRPTPVNPKKPKGQKNTPPTIDVDENGNPQPPEAAAGASGKQPPAGTGKAPASPAAPPSPESPTPAPGAAPQGPATASTPAPGSVATPGTPAAIGGGTQGGGASGTVATPPTAAPVSNAGQPPAVSGGSAPVAAPAPTVDTGAHGAATSPQNDLPHPTPKQEDAENFKVGPVKLGPEGSKIDMSITHPAGAVRSGTDSKGNDWQTTVQSHIGYIKRAAIGADKEKLDVVIKPGTPLDYNGPVFVVNQNHPATHENLADLHEQLYEAKAQLTTASGEEAYGKVNARIKEIEDRITHAEKGGKFDESKSIFGASSEAEARDLYLANYPAGQEKNIDSVAHFPSVTAFKEWSHGASRRTAPAKGIEPQITNEKPPSTQGPTPQPPTDEPPRPGSTPQAEQGPEVQPGDNPVSPGQHRPAKPRTREQIAKIVDAAIKAKAEQGAAVRPWREGDPKMPDGLQINPDTKEILHDIDRIHSDATEVDRQGGKGARWIVAAVREEFDHALYFDVIGPANDVAVGNTLWDDAKPETAAAMADLRPEYRDRPWMLAAEAIRIIRQYASKEGVTESFIPSYVPRLNKLLLAIEKEGIPESWENVLQRMKGVQSAAADWTGSPTQTPPAKPKKAPKPVSPKAPKPVVQKPIESGISDQLSQALDDAEDALGAASPLGLGAANPSGPPAVKRLSTEVLPVFTKLLEAMRDEGVKTPEAFARVIMTRKNPDKWKPYTQALWGLLGSVTDPEGWDYKQPWPDVFKGLEAAPPAAPPKQSPSMDMASWVQRQIASGVAFDWRALFRAADTFFGGTQAEGKYTSKDAYDAMELGVNKFVIANAEKIRAMEPKEAVKFLTEMIGKLPTQSKRSEEQDEYQQFSTPPPFGYIAAWVANLKPDDVLAETSAGTASLAAFGKVFGVKEILLNELSSRRAALLRELGIGDVTEENGELIHSIWPAGKKVTVATINPPFSATAGRNQGERDTMNGAKHIETLLKRLPPGGRLVAIVGEGMKMVGGDSGPRSGRNSGTGATFEKWWDGIKAEYNVRANIGVSGKNYAKYGTTFDNQILVIDKDGPTTETLTGNIEDLNELIDKLQPIRDSRPDATREDQQPDSDESRPPTAPEPPGVPPARPDGPRNRPGGSGQGSGALDQPTPRPPAGEIEPANPPNGAPAGTGGGTKPTGGRSGNAGAPDAGDQGAGSGPGDLTLPEGDAALIEKADEVKPLDSEEVFSDYSPQKVAVTGAKPHPTALVESSSMRSVAPPDVTYAPKIPKALLESGALSLPQFEAIVYAGQAHQTIMENGERAGYFIGDGTGVGKGREITGIFIDNFIQGRQKGIWISERKGLIDNAKGDFGDLGMPDVSIVDLGKVKAKTGSVKFDKGILFSTYSTMIGDFKTANIPPQYGAGATVRYNNATWTVNKSRQAGRNIEMTIENAARETERVTEHDVTPLTPAKGLKSRLDQIVEWFGPEYDGVIVFDEAHNAKNAITVRGARGTSNPSSTGLATVELQRRLPKARIVYASATGATEVYNLAYADRLGIWGAGAAFATKADFFNRISAAGISAMEIVARDMKALGRYTARTLSFGPADSSNPEDKGVEVGTLEHKLTPEQVRTYDSIARTWQTVYTNMQSTLASTGAANNSNARGAARGAFFSSQQRFFNQLLTALQVPTLIKDMHEKLAQGHAIIIQLTNTNEATLDRALAKADEEQSDLEDLDLTPKDILKQYVDQSFPVQAFETFTDQNGNVRSRPVVDSQGRPVLDPDAVAQRDMLLSEISRLPVPTSPMEQIFDEFGADKVSEITGRSVRVVKKMVDGEMKMVREQRNEAVRKVEAKEFIDNKRRILIFSQAGGTGFSYHADQRFANQRRRYHYLLQAGWSADKAIQGLGRAHRSGQVVPPFLQLLRTNLEGHKRFISTIARRLAQLGALTSGERRASGRGLFSDSDNLENQYADFALTGLVKSSFRDEEPDLAWDTFTQKMGFDNMVKPDGSLNENKIPDVPQFLNRLLNLEVDEQNTVFHAFIARMERSIAFAKEHDTYDPGLQTLKVPRGGSVTLTDEEEVYQHPGVDQPTKLVDILRRSPVEFKDFDDTRRIAKSSAHDSSSDSPEENQTIIARNRKSGMVAIFSPARERTDAQTGQMMRQYQRFGIRGYVGHIDREKVDLREPEPLSQIGGANQTTVGAGPKITLEQTPITGLTKYAPKSGNWERLTPDQARSVWADNIEKSDKFDEEEMTLLTGLMLPIWDRTGLSSPQVFRVNAGDKSFLGVKIPAKNVAAVRRKLGAAKGIIKPEDAFRSVIEDGVTYTLANDWKLQRRRVSGENRIEVTGMTYNEGENFKRFMGGFSERIGYDTRYFVPTDPEAGIETLGKLLNQSPIVDDGQALGAASPGAGRERLSPEEAVDRLAEYDREKPDTWPEDMQERNDEPVEKPVRSDPRTWRFALTDDEQYLAENGHEQDDSADDLPATKAELDELYGKAWQQFHELQNTADARAADAEKRLLDLGYRKRGSEWEEPHVLFAASPSGQGAAAKAEPFYSQLTRTVQSLPQETMTVDQARAAIEKGAKKDEIAMSGILTDPLSPLVGKQPGEKVSKSELAGYAIERQARVQDVVLGGSEPISPALRRYLDESGYGMPTTSEEWLKFSERMEKSAQLLQRQGDPKGAEKYFSHAEEANRRAEGLSPETGSTAGETHFSQYQLPGADEGTYREQFVTWPKATVTPSRAAVDNWKIKREPNPAYPNSQIARVYPDSGDEVFLFDVKGKTDAEVRTLASAEVTKRLLRDVTWSDGHPQYGDIANPIVRIRRNIRTDAEGKKTYFLEELQGPAKGEQEKMPPEIRKRIYEIGMKRALRDAADEGADAIGWTTGAQQSERYDISKQVDAVYYNPETQRLIANKGEKGTPHHQRLVDKEGVKPEQLADYIGKDAAEKLMAQEPNVNGLRSLTGEDLKIESAGLKRLYDQTLPRIANELAKKFGVKVGTAEIDSSAAEGYSNVRHFIENGRDQWETNGVRYNSLAEAEKHAPASVATVIHSLPIPEAMRAQQQEQGNALFAASPAGNAAENIGKLGNGRSESGRDAKRAAQAAAMGAKGGALKAAFARVSAAGKSVAHYFTELEPVTDYTKAVGEWTGAGGTGKGAPNGRQVIAMESRRLLEEITKRFPNKLSRMAVSRYIEAEGNLSVLGDQETRSKGALKEVYQRAQNLAPEEKKLASEIRDLFNKLGQVAQDAGVLRELLENYVSHFVDRSSIPLKNHGTVKAQILGDVALGKLKTNFDHARHRVMENMFDLEQGGIRLATSDIAEIVAAYNQALGEVINNRTFVKSLTSIMAADGRPIAITSGAVTMLDADEEGGDGPLLVKPFARPKDTDGYVTIDHPALRKWRWRTTVDGRDVFVQGELLIHPDAAKHLKNALGKSAMMNNPLIRGLTILQAEAKSIMLGWSAFHFVQEGTHAIGHGVNPFKLYELNPDDPLTRELMNAGLMVASFNAKAEFSEGLAASGMGKLLAHVGLGKLGDLNDALTDFLFSKYIPGLKVAMAKKAFARNLDRWKRQLDAGKITRAQVAQKTAQQANDAFGEQNNMYMGNDPTRIHAERLGFLAPDFLKSRAKFFADAFRKYGGEQRRALLWLAIVMMVTAKIIERMLTGKNRWDKPFTVVTPHREYELRSVPGDVLEMVQDPRRFISGRLSPLIARPTLEAITGRDYRGRKRSPGEQLMDLIKTPIPIAARSFIDKDAPELSPIEQAGSSLGFRARRHSVITETRILGHDWQAKKGFANADEVYPPSKYLTLRNALEDNNLDRARHAYEELQKTAPKKKVDEGFTESLNKPFSGSKAHEREFVASLSPADRQKYANAVAERARLQMLFHQISHYQPAAGRNSGLMFTGFH